MKKLSYLFAVAASAACLCACTDVTDVLPAEQIPADARSTLGADVVLQWNNEEQTIDGFGVAQAGWSDYLYAHRKRQEIMDVMFGQDGLRLSILRGEVFPHYDETTFNMDEDINLSLDDPFFDIDFNRDENRVAEGIAQRNGQLWIMKKAKQEYGVDKLIFSVWSAPADARRYQRWLYSSFLSKGERSPHGWPPNGIASACPCCSCSFQILSTSSSHAT